MYINNWYPQYRDRPDNHRYIIEGIALADNPIQLRQSIDVIAHISSALYACDAPRLAAVCIHAYIMYHDEKSTIKAFFI